MSGRAARPPRAGRLPEPARVVLLLAPALAVVVVLFGGGVALAVAQSFGYLPFLPGWTWSLDAYRDLPSDAAVRASVGLTLRLSLTATALASVLAVAGALLVRSTRRGRGLLSAVLASSLPVPHVVGAAAVLLLLGPAGWASRVTTAAGLTEGTGDFPVLVADPVGWGILAEYVWKETPFIGVVALAALASPRTAQLEDAARSLGAGWWWRLRAVLLPRVLPGVVATSVIVFAFTFGSYEVPRLLGQRFPATLPVVALESYRDTDLRARPTAMAICVVLTVVVVAAVLLYLRVVERLVRPEAAGAR